MAGWSATHPLKQGSGATRLLCPGEPALVSCEPGRIKAPSPPAPRTPEQPPPRCTSFLITGQGTPPFSAQLHSASQRASIDHHCNPVTLPTPT